MDQKDRESLNNATCVCFTQHTHEIYHRSTQSKSDCPAVPRLPRSYT